jgi:Domain of unknown function (DUF4375)
MAKSIDQTLAESDPSALCEGLFQRILEHQGDEPDAASMTEEERTVYLVWRVKGLVMEGGFGRFFEGNIKGDPAFSRTVAAMEKIGAQKATEAMKQTMALFGGSRAPLDAQIRIRQYEKRTQGAPTKMDVQFKAADEEVNHSLATFIRKNREAFLNMGSSAVGQEQKAGSASDVERKASAALGGLPHWARVAFAARCARQAHQLAAGRSQLSNESAAALLRAIELAEESASSGDAADGLQQAAEAALASVQAGSGATASPSPGLLAANAAQSAALCARAHPADSAALASDAWLAARNSAAAAGETGVMAGLKKEFTSLYQAAQHSKWSDGTKIPLEIWNMI